MRPADALPPIAPADHGQPPEDELLNDLRGRDGLVFAAYQRPSLLRRVRRRMEQAGADGFPAYRAVLAADPGEHRRLCEAVPVHRTEFFRDPAVWAHLAAAVVPGLPAGKAGQPVRAWSAGCATGEEAYTLAMVLAEAAGPAALAGRRVTVFATDVSERAVAAARAGRYRAESVAAVPPGLREKYFRPDGDGWAVVRPALRACVTFARHDLLRDPPLPRLDLVACRNTLMYFTPEFQARALARLYLGLRDGGALLVGRTESPQVWTDLFRAESLQHRVYRRAGGRSGDALALVAGRRPPARQGRPA